MNTNKESYWMNCYLPFGNYENILLLPIIYLILGVCLFLGIGLGHIDINAIIMAVLALYFIIYDFVYKVKKKKSKNGDFDDSKMINYYMVLTKVFSNMIKICSSFLVFIILLFLFFQTKDLTSKLMFLPFLICVSLAFWHTISSVFGNIKLGALLMKLYVISFLTFWFGMIGVGLYYSIVNGEYGMIIFMIPFILAGGYVVRKMFINK